MVKPLTQHQTEIITDLFHTTNGQAGVFVEADTQHHSPLYWMAHESRGVIEIQKKRRKGKVYRSIALTTIGVRYCMEHGINARQVAYMPPARKRERVTIGFQLSLSDAMVGQVGQCKSKQEFIPVIRLAMQLYGVLGYQGMKALTRDTANLSEAISIAYAEIEALQAETENERQRLTLERAALEAQTLEVKQFHDIFRDIDAKLDSLQHSDRSAEKRPVSVPVQDKGQDKPEDLKQLPVAEIAPPDTSDLEDDDSLLMVVESTVDKKTYSENFLRSLGALDKKE